MQARQVRRGRSQRARGAHQKRASHRRRKAESQLRKRHAPQTTAGDTSLMAAARQVVQSAMGVVPGDDTGQAQRLAELTAMELRLIEEIKLTQAALVEATEGTTHTCAGKHRCYRC